MWCLAICNYVFDEHSKEKISSFRISDWMKNNIINQIDVTFQLQILKFLWAKAKDTMKRQAQDLES